MSKLRQIFRLYRGALNNLRTSVRLLDRVMFRWCVVMWVYALCTILNLRLHFIPAVVLRRGNYTLAVLLVAGIIVQVWDYKRVMAQINREYQEERKKIQADSDVKVEVLIGKLKAQVGYEREMCEEEQNSVLECVVKLRELGTPGKFDADLNLLESCVEYWRGH